MEISRSTTCLANAGRRLKVAKLDPLRMPNHRILTTPSTEPACSITREYCMQSPLQGVGDSQITLFGFRLHNLFGKTLGLDIVDR